ncbi:MAG: NAD(P)/FAD-dependent oxidoreductase [Smithellaceae bacterium]|nr:NAD(P)/FAD-dependent oxidoreductase [Smithellaceae bacterium]
MKAAIIGAGPGGLYAALAAAKNNIQIDLFEKRNVGDGIVCGECIFDSLGIMKKPGRGLLHPVDEVVLQGCGCYVFPLGRHRKLWMLDRRSWQQELARCAARGGVTLYEHTKITPARLLEMKKEYDWIIDASGAPSITSRLNHFSNDYFKEYLLAHQVKIAGDFSALWPRIKIAFLPDMPADYQPAYAWIFPKDTRRANIGVVCTVRGTLKKDKLDLKNVLAQTIRKEGLDGVHVLERGSGMAAAGMLPRLVYDNIILAGDAAGLTSPLHGGGIDMACLSGVMAVDVIVNGNSGVAEYREKLERYTKEKLALEKVTIQKMKTLNFEQFDDLLEGITSKSFFTRFRTALGHREMFYVTLKWFGTKKRVPDWPV